MIRADGSIDIWSCYHHMDIEIRELDTTPEHESARCTSEVTLVVEHTWKDNPKKTTSRYGYRCVNKSGHVGSHVTMQLVWNGDAQVFWPQEPETALVLSALQGRPPTTVLTYRTGALAQSGGE